MHTLNGRRRPVTDRMQVALAQIFPAGPDSLKLGTFWLWHGLPSLTLLGVSILQRQHRAC
jgi:hypothetical protein